MIALYLLEGKNSVLQENVELPEMESCLMAILICLAFPPFWFVYPVDVEVPRSACMD